MSGASEHYLKALNRCALRHLTKKKLRAGTHDGAYQASSALLHAVSSTPQCSEQAVPRVKPERGAAAGIRCSVREDGRARKNQGNMKQSSRKINETPLTESGILSAGWVMGGLQGEGSWGRRWWQVAARGEEEKVSSCKLKVSGKDRLLPNIQSREQLAFAAAGGEEMVLSKPPDSATVLDGSVRVHAPWVQRVVHPWTSGQRKLSLQRWASFWASLQFLNRCSGWTQSSPCPSSAATECRPIATDAVSILRELMHTCARLRRPYGPEKEKEKSLQRLYIFCFYFYASFKCFLRIMIMCLVCMCLHVWMWNHALVYMWLLWNLRKHCR